MKDKEREKPRSQRTEVRGQKIGERRPRNKRKTRDELLRSDEGRRKKEVRGQEKGET